MGLEQDVAKAIAVFRKLGQDVTKSRQKILNDAAKPFVQAAKATAPTAPKAHKRYNTPKLSRRMRAPNGMGRVAATYYPGNLRRSVRIMKFAAAKSKVFVGARLARGNKTGEFKGNRVDGYYLHMVEFGTRTSAPRPFWRAAWMGTRGAVSKNITDGFRDVIKRYENVQGT